MILIDNIKTMDIIFKILLLLFLISAFIYVVYLLYAFSRIGKGVFHNIYAKEYNNLSNREKQKRKILKKRITIYGWIVFVTMFLTILFHFMRL